MVGVAVRFRPGGRLPLVSEKVKSVLVMKFKEYGVFGRAFRSKATYSFELSKAPISTAAPAGRKAPRWSVVIATGGFAAGQLRLITQLFPALIAGDPDTRAELTPIPP